MTAPLRYRTMGEAVWRAGKTVNISASGMLFEAESPLPRGMTVEVWLQLPLPAKRQAAQISGAGVVVRAEEERHPPQTAARFLDFTLTPAEYEMPA